jgi:hypothetical protein
MHGVTEQQFRGQSRLSNAGITQQFRALAESGANRQFAAIPSSPSFSA